MTVKRLGLLLTSAILGLPPAPFFAPTPAALAADSAPPAAQPPPSIEDWFQRLDKNHDGKLSRDEMEALPRLKAAFDNLDANHDGGISLAEMKAALAQWQSRRPAPEPPPATNAPPKRVAPRPPKEPASPRLATVDANSPQFRGPRGDGVAYGANLPVAWSTTTNVLWACAIPGKGWSSPIIWGDRVFVTSVLGPGSVQAPPELRGIAENTRGVTTTNEHQYLLHCVDWRTGKLLWSRCAHQGVPPGSIHPKNTYASATPVTDGERVYAYFGNVGLFCYDLDGRQLWSRQWGVFKMDWNWGPAASPALHGDLLFVLNDNQEKSFLVALDKRTGQDVWRVERDEKSNWTTPFIWTNALRTEIVTSGTGKVRSYDLHGKLLWELRGMSGVTVPTPFAAEGLLYIASGCQHSSLRPIYAIRPGATSDISLQADAVSNAYIAWAQRRAAPYVTSPLVYDGLLYVLLDKGTLAAYDARTGEEVYSKQRFTTAKADFTASPWAYDDKLFCLTETGETYVVAAGPEFRVLGVNRLDEAALATPAVARDSLIVRTLTKLYRIANPAVAPAQPQPMRDFKPMPQDFKVEDLPLTSPGCAFTDPEYNDAQHRVTYWDYTEPGNIKVFVGELDATTGLFTKPPGRDYLVAEHVSPFFKDGKWWAHNGPEWGCDQNGWTVFFTKEDAQGTRQLWRATPSGARYAARQLTTLPGGACGGLYTQNPKDADTGLMFYVPDRDTVVWAAASAPNQVHELPGFRGFKSISHWVPGTKWISYVRRVDGSSSPQLVYLDTQTGAVHQISDEPGEKYDAWGFRAPEFGGEVLLMCVIDHQQIAIYRDLAKNGKPWTRIATLALPANAPHTHPYSVEPIAPESGVNGTSWFSLNAMASETGRHLVDTGRSSKDGSIWVLSLGANPAKRIARRVDEGAVSGIQTTRYEAESMLGANEVFIYYERKSPETGRGEVRRCRTGISLMGKPSATSTSK